MIHTIFQIDRAEKWSPIKGYEGLYEVSSLGRVKSLKRRSRLKDSIMKLVPTGAGYASVGLSRNGSVKTFAVARLVGEHFIPRLDPGLQINHINGIKTDNHMENLEWVTVSENNKHAHRMGLRDTHGEGHPSAKLNNAQVYRIRLIKEVTPNMPLNILAKMFNITKGSISNIHLGRTWSHI